MNLKGLKAGYTLGAPPQDQFKFRVHCDAGESGQLNVTTDALFIRVGQPIRREGRAEIWDSLVVQCAHEDDGSFAVKVMIYNLDWDEPKEIVIVRSKPEAQEMLNFELSS